MLFAAVAIVPVAAHTLPLQTVAYFKVEGTSLRVLVRLPMATLADARVPLSVRGTLDLGVIRPTFDAAAADFVKSADIMDGDRPLRASAVTWVVSTKDDASFASYQTAAAHFAGPPLPVDTEIGANEGFVDLKLDYPLSSPAPRVSVRFNGQRSGGEFLPTEVTYLPASGDERRLRIVGAPRRVSFEPSGLDAAAMFLKLGAERLLDERELLLLLVCLAIPLRTASLLLTGVGMTLAAYVTTGVLVSIAPSPPGVRLELLSQLTASIALVMAALQNVAVPREAWVRVVCLIFGVASGVGVGIDGRDVLPLGGSHGFLSLVLFLGTGAAGTFVFVPFLRAFLGMFHRLPLPERAVTVLLSLVPLHTALHRVQNNGQLLIDTGGRASPAAMADWPAFLAVLSLVLLALAARFSARGQGLVGEGPNRPGRPGH